MEKEKRKRKEVVDKGREEDRVVREFMKRRDKRKMKLDKNRRLPGEVRGGNIKDAEDKRWELKERQGLPLEIKIRMSKDRIEEWYRHWNGRIYVSFSGGKDSTALLHLVRSMYPEVPAVFVDTGLEFPEIRKFVKRVENVTWLRPKMPFFEVIEKYGYPIISKESAAKLYDIQNTRSEKVLKKRLYGDKFGRGRLPEKWKYLIDADFKISDRCCMVMKKAPIMKYIKENNRAGIIGTMADDSRLRTTNYLMNGCNVYRNYRPTSTPIAFWVEQDVVEYINRFNLDYSEIYDMGYANTGCIFCAFGVHLEYGENRFQRLYHTHPKHYWYCIEKLGMGKVLEAIGVNYKVGFCKDCRYLGKELNRYIDAEGRVSGMYICNKKVLEKTNAYNKACIKFVLKKSKAVIV